MIKINDLHKSYKMGSNSLHVLKGINFNVEEGELVAIMGSSGSGKSTLLNILGMLDLLDKGSYELDNVPIRDLDETKAELSYNDLPIKEGGTASNTFLSMVNGTFEGDVEETRRQLLEYCELDTYAMVKILEKLLQV